MSKQIEEKITKIIDSYERMLEKFLEKGERFDSAPFTLAIKALDKLISDEEVEND